MMKISKTARLAMAVALASVLGFGSVYQAADAAEKQELFVALSAPDAVQDKDAAVDPTIFRSRFVRIDWDTVNLSSQDQAAGAGMLVLNLFEDAIFSVVVDRREIRSNKSFTWLGYVDGVRDSQVILVVEDGVMVGNIRVGDTYFQVRYVAADLHVVSQIDETRFPSDGEPIAIDTPKSEAVQDMGTTGADSGSIFDVMVVYTPAARAAAGGTTAMSALINLAVAETNTAYLRSGVIPRVRLVHKEEVSYTEAVDDFLTDLNRLTDPSDGFMDNVHALRNAHGADLVSLYIEGTALCGIAWLMTTESNAFEAFAFSVVARICATGNYTFGHEMGHNMGLRHDRINDPNPGVFAHSHGYADGPNNFRDIMGVATSCGGCPRIQNFSNPNIFFNGHPTGVSQASPNSADAAASLNATALTVANWRSHIQTVAPFDFDLDGQTDATVYRTDNGDWFVVGTAQGFFTPALNFGGAGFIPVSGDYDGDGKTDVAVYQESNGNWFVVGSTDGFFTPALNFGGTGFIPVPGDYDGDGETDVAVYQESNGNWFVVGSTDGFFTPALNFGGSGFIPVPGDYDGDGKTDTAVYQTNTGNWFVVGSTQGFFTPALNFGGAGYLPVPGDYDGDGKADPGVYQSSTGNWFVMGSTSGFLQALNFGGSGFTPVAGDYDGDERIDVAVYQTSNGNWFVVGSSVGFFIPALNFGGSGFVPVIPQVTILKALGLL